MPRFKQVNGVKVQLTDEEEAQRDLDSANFIEGTPLREWKDSIEATDSGMPRYLEDLITDNPDFNIHENMKTRYDEKVALRATKP